MATTAGMAFDSRDDVLTQGAPAALALRGLASLIATFAPHDGAFPLRLPGTYALRLSQMNTEPAYSSLGPSLCLIAQGAKAVPWAIREGCRRVYCGGRQGWLREAGATSLGTLMYVEL